MKNVLSRVINVQMAAALKLTNQFPQITVRNVMQTAARRCRKTTLRFVSTAIRICTVRTDNVEVRNDSDEEVLVPSHWKQTLVKAVDKLLSIPVFKRFIQAAT